MAAMQTPLRSRSRNSATKLAHLPATALFLSFALRTFAAVDFTDVLLLADGSFASLTADTVNEWPALGGQIRLEFQTSNRNRAVWLGGNRNKREVRALDMPVYEIQAGFSPDTGALSSVEFVLFSRGDVVQAGGGDGEIGRLVSGAVHDDKAFRDLFARVKERFETTFGKVAQSRVQHPVKGHEQRQFAWNVEKGRVLLSVGRTESGNTFRGEYIRVAVAPPDGKRADASSGPKPSGMPDAGRITARSADLASNVVRKEDGSTYVDNIPMVDQGDKGYCVVATLERIVRYYGGSTSQHELAQLLNTADGGGTAIRYDRFVSPSVCKRFNFKQEAVRFERPDPKKVLQRYNAAAAVKIDTGKKKDDKSLEAALSAADPATLREAVSGMKECREFVSSVRKYVDAGIPLVWGVPGHIRMIVGYNETAGKILYSDSWGANHERNEMSVAEALLSTKALFAVHP